MEKCNYWRYYKSDGKFFLAGPKAKNTIKETWPDTEINSKFPNSGTLEHLLQYGDKKFTYISHHGYDRGPRLQIILRKIMFG